MKSPVRVFLIWALAASVVLGAQSRLVPAPDASFGFKPGADFKLANYDQSIEYFRKLAAASRFLRLVEAGKTSQGRTMYFALISNPKNLDQVERYRQIAQRLAHPAGLTDATARELAREGKPFIHIDGGLHSTEVAGAQHTPLLAYDLVSRAQAEDPAVKAILDNVILMLWPTINPDGQQMVADWYMSNVGTPYELSGLPQLYQEYVGHDNNRDAYMLNMIESRVIEQTWRDWEPSIVYVHHQSSPFPTRIWLPPFSEPIGSDAPFLMSREVNMIGMAIAKGLEEKGQVGRDAHGDRRSTPGIPGTSITRRTSRTSRHSGPRPRSFSTRRRVSIRLRTSPRASATSVRRASTRARGARAGGGSETPWRTCTRPRSRCSSMPPSTRSRCSSTATWPAAIRSRGGGARRRLPTSSRRSSAIPWPLSSCCAGWRSAAFASRS